MRNFSKIFVLMAVAVPVMPLLAQKQHHGPLLLVCNKGNHTLGIVDPVAGKEIAEVQESGITGHEVKASPDGRFAYVPIYGNAGVGDPGTDGSTMDVIDLATKKVVRTKDFGAGVRPHLPVFGPKNHLLYVSNELAHRIVILDPKTLDTLGTIPTNANLSHMFVITKDGKTAFVTNVMEGSISELDLVNKKVVRVAPVTPFIQRISITPDNTKILTADQHNPRVAVIDTKTLAVKQWIPLEDVGYGSTITPDGKWYMIVHEKTSKVSFVNLATMKVEHVVPVSTEPQAVVAPGNGMAYVSGTRDGKVDVISLADFTVKKVIPVGPAADGMTWVPAN